jgi:hypothetical protein
MTKSELSYYPSMSEPANVGNLAFSDLIGEQRAEPVPPTPDRFVADVDASLGEQVLDAPQ